MCSRPVCLRIRKAIKTSPVNEYDNFRFQHFSITSTPASTDSSIMSKRLNKRQQRELEELEQLKAEERKATAQPSQARNENQQTQDKEDEEDVEEEDEDEDEGDAPVNPFAAVSPRHMSIG
jgi:hypothetical protein